MINGLKNNFDHKKNWDSLILLNKQERRKTVLKYSLLIINSIKGEVVLYTLALRHQDTVNLKSTLYKLKV